VLPEARTPAGERLARRLASSHTRRGFLGRLGAAALAAVSGRLAASAVSPDAADAHYYGFCGHTFTTHHCPSPYFPPRIDLHGRPLRPKDGHRVDNLGAWSIARATSSTRAANAYEDPPANFCRARLAPASARTGSVSATG
jgi:hypothetical protein